MAYLNIKFPLETSPKGDFLNDDRSTAEAIRSNLILLLLSDKGERFYFPSWGANLRRHIFEPSDGVTMDEIRQTINDSVRKFLPDVTITDLEIVDASNFGEAKDVKITYSATLGDGLRINDVIFLDLTT